MKALLTNWKLVLVGLVLAALVFVLGVQTVRLAEASTQIAEGRANLASYKAAAAENTVLMLRAARAEEARLQVITGKVIDEAHSQTVTARAAAGRADAAAARLSEQLAAARAAAERARADSAAASPGTGEPSADPIGVFAGLLERADRRAGIVERYADALGIAGSTCERYADGLQPGQP
ncbi:DUF2514 family protein [Variovorax sp. RCC_210]|uniref:DUF2514 family protein n=1 Tax=Variovorax sp. RCC_210 TaxID=3239217 RepID=UPI003524B6A8